VKVASEVTRRSMAKLSDAQTAGCAWKKSCYNGIDYTIGDECTVFEGERMVCMRVGHLIYAHLTLSFLFFAKRSKSWLLTMLVALLPRTQTVSKRLGTTLLLVRQSLSVSLLTSLSRRFTSFINQASFLV
jgi:hypothetical protein